VRTEFNAKPRRREEEDKTVYGETMPTDVERVASAVVDSALIKDGIKRIVLTEHLKQQLHPS